MLNINNRVLLKHYRLFRKPEVIMGKITDVKKYEVEDDYGRTYNQTYYHIMLNSGKNIVLRDKNSHPAYFQTYSIILA